MDRYQLDDIKNIHCGRYILGKENISNFLKNPRSSFLATRGFVTHNERGDAGIAYFLKEKAAILEINDWLYPCQQPDQSIFIEGSTRFFYTSVVADFHNHKE